jgi:hypothetical protein
LISPQDDGHAAEAKGNLKSDLGSPQLKNDAVAVLQGRDLATADKSASGASTAIGAGDRSWAGQICGCPDEVDRRDAKTAQADAAHSKAVSSTVVIQDAAAASDADDESGFDDVQADLTDSLCV